MVENRGMLVAGCAVLAILLAGCGELCIETSPSSGVNPIMAAARNGHVYAAWFDSAEGGAQLLRIDAAGEETLQPFPDLAYGRWDVPVHAIGNSTLAVLPSQDHAVLLSASEARSIPLGSVIGSPVIVFDGTQYLVLSSNGYGLHQRALREDGTLGETITFAEASDLGSVVGAASDEAGTVLVDTGNGLILLIDENAGSARVLPDILTGSTGSVWMGGRFFGVHYTNQAPSLVSVSSTGVVEKWPVEIPPSYSGTLLSGASSLVLVVGGREILVADPTLRQFVSTGITNVGPPSGYGDGVLTFQREPVDSSGKRFALSVNEIKLDAEVVWSRRLAVDGPLVTRTYSCGDTN